MVDLDDILVDELLNLIDGALLLVFGDRILLVLLLVLQPLHGIVADAAHRDPARLGLLMYLLDKLLAALFVKLRNIQADIIAIVVRGNTYVGLEDPLLDRTKGISVEWRYEQLARLRHRYSRDLVYGKLLPVHLHAHVLENRRA